MLTFIAVVAFLAVILLAFIAALLRATRFAVHLVSQQLEYLGAPLEITDGVLHAARRGFEKNRR
jgi:hypothetical protein